MANDNDNDNERTPMTEYLIATSRLAGVTFQPGYPNNLADLVERCHAGPVPLELVRDPENAYDLNAVRVECEGSPLGHLPRELAAEVALLIDSGEIVKAVAAFVAVAAEHQDRPGLEVELWSDR